MTFKKTPHRSETKLSKESMYSGRNFENSSLVLSWYNSTRVKLAQNPPEAIQRFASSRPPIIKNKQNQPGGLLLPPLKLKDVIRNSQTRHDCETQKAQTSRDRFSARRSVFGDWYLPPSQWQKMHTARNWASANDVESSVLDSLLQREEREDNSLRTLHELKKHEEKLAQKMKAEIYVVSSFKDFVKRNGYRQPRFLKRIKTPNKNTLKKTKTEIEFAAHSDAPLVHADSFVPELADFLSSNFDSRLSKERSW